MEFGRRLLALTAGFYSSLFDQDITKNRSLAETVQSQKSVFARAESGLDLIKWELLTSSSQEQLLSIDTNATLEVITEAFTFWNNALKGTLNIREPLAFDADIMISSTFLSCSTTGFNSFVLPAKEQFYVIVMVMVIEMDGIGGIGARAGPCATFKNNVILGRLYLDIDDIPGLLDSYLLLPVVKHEIAHVLGYGTRWSTNSLLKNPCTTIQPCNSDPKYSGAAGNKAFHELLDSVSYVDVNESTDIPVENAGSKGVVNSHWRESFFSTELMTSILNGNTNPLSKMSLSAMEDLNFVVNLTYADGYMLPDNSSSTLSPTLSGQIEIDLHNDTDGNTSVEELSPMKALYLKNKGAILFFGSMFCFSLLLVSFLLFMKRDRKYNENNRNEIVVHESLAVAERILSEPSKVHDSKECSYENPKRASATNDSNSIIIPHTSVYSSIEGIGKIASSWYANLKKMLDDKYYKTPEKKDFFEFVHDLNL